MRQSQCETHQGKTLPRDTRDGRLWVKCPYFSWPVVNNNAANIRELKPEGVLWNQKVKLSKNRKIS
jgi:hypothetical protein